MTNRSAMAASEESLLQWVTFRLDNETYGINVMQVQEVLRVGEIAPVPGAPDYVMGIINLRGNVVTVLDTRRRFGLDPKENDEATRIVVIEAGDNVVGILVDGVAEVVELAREAVECSPNVGNDDSAKYIEGVAHHAGELLILVDINKLLGEEEWAEMSHY